MSEANPFSQQSDGYARARPDYPATLYDWIAEQCDHHRAAWDCATGNGQAAVGLAAHFDRVFATDLSEAQIAHAFPCPNVAYSVAPAERSGLPDRSVDLIAVAQALHWFDFARFWPEVQRVARPGAFFCAWGYAWMTTDRIVDDQLLRPFLEQLAPFWAPELQLLWDGYPDAALAGPFERIDPPAFAIERDWTLAELVDYLKTWSAYKQCQAEPAVVAALDAAVADVERAVAPDRRLRISMPLTVIAGRITGIAEP